MSIRSFSASAAWMKRLSVVSCRFRSGTAGPSPRLVMTIRGGCALAVIPERLLSVAVLIRHSRRRGVDVLGTQIVEQRLLLAGEEAQLQPAEDVIHDRLGVADVRVMGPAAGLEAGVRELVAQQLERNAVLQARWRPRRQSCPSVR